MNRSALVAAALLTLVPLAQAATGPNLPAMSAEQLVEKNVAARGGLAAWRAVQTLTSEGEMEAGGTDNRALPFVLRQKRPKKSRLEIVFKGQTAVQVFDGTRGWKLRPFLNRLEVEPYTAAETAEAAAADTLDGPLIDYASRGARVALDGTDLVEGHPAYRLKVSSRDGAVRHVWIDAKSFLDVQMDGDPRLLDGKPRAVKVLLRDFRSEHGLIMPHLQETLVEGVKQSHKLTLRTVAVNPPLDDALFAKPAVADASAKPAKP